MAVKGKSRRLQQLVNEFTQPTGETAAIANLENLKHALTWWS